MQPEEIERMIESGLSNSKAFVDGDGTHFEAIVVSPEFSGKTRIQKQQLVNETVKQHLLNGSLHALSIKTFTPEEWEAIDPDKEA